LELVDHNNKFIGKPLIEVLVFFRQKVTNEVDHFVFAAFFLLVAIFFRNLASTIFALGLQLLDELLERLHQVLFPARVFEHKFAAFGLELFNCRLLQFSQNFDHSFANFLDRLPLQLLDRRLEFSEVLGFQQMQLGVKASEERLQNLGDHLLLNSLEDLLVVAARV
jgi:hypothetical protein